MTIAATRPPLPHEQDQARVCAAFLEHLAEGTLGRRLADRWPLARYEAIYRGQVRRIADLIRDKTALQIELQEAEDTWRRRALAAESEAESLRRQLARALLLGANPPGAGRDAAPRPRSSLPARALYSPAEPPEERFAPAPDRDPSADAVTIVEPPRENPRQAQLLLLALTYPDALDDSLDDITWTGPLAREAAGWLGREDRAPAALLARLEGFVPPSTAAFLRPGADGRKILAVIAECAAWERVANLKAEIATATSDLDGEDIDAAWVRFQALHEELRLAEGRLAASANEEDMHHG